jgi:hypothetical protein
MRIALPTALDRAMIFPGCCQHSTAVVQLICNQKTSSGGYCAAFVRLPKGGYRELDALAKPEQFKIFLLGAMAGLRRNEIDKLPWTAFRWDEGVIRIQATEFFRPKSRDSEGDVLVDPELLEIFRGYYARCKGDFVIESACEPGAPYDHYRCHRDIAELIGWLRSKGVVSRMPLHTLRNQAAADTSRFRILAPQAQ